MALFKISKGKVENLSKQAITEGYAWFTPDDGKFYIDAHVTENGSEVLKRVPLNAEKADKLTVISKGSGTQPVYFDSNGQPVAIKYTIQSSVPSGAKFTDTVYTHPTTSGNKHIPSGGSSGQILRWSADGTAAWGSDNNTDTKVTQTLTSTNASYPLLLAPSGQSGTATTTSYFDSGVTLNPSTNTIAGNISGSAASLSSKFYAGRQITPTSLYSTEVNMPPYTCLALKNAGTRVYEDSEFANGVNGVELYDNNGSGKTAITRVADSTAANSSGYVLKITISGTGQTPGYGGFYQDIKSRANAVFFQLFRAKIPVGYKIVNASNSMGTSYSDQFITDTAGTGKWEWYGRIVCCGSTGSFSGGGHIYLDKTTGATPSSSAPVIWYLSYCNVFDLSKGAEQASSTNSGIVSTTTQTFAGNKTFSGTLTATGATTLKSTLNVSGATTFNNDVTVNSSYIISQAKAPTEKNHLVNKTYADNLLTVNDALLYKGTVNSSLTTEDTVNGLYKDLPATHKQGWTFKVAYAGTYAGVNCEIGDTIYCITDGTAANNAHWTVVQTNIDGAVVGPSSSTDNAIARFNSTTGKIIQNSGVTIDDSNNLTVPGTTALKNTLNSYTANNVALNLRPDNSSYYTTLSYQTDGNEAAVFATKSAVTSFLFVNGEDSVTNHSSSRWKSITGTGVQIKNNCVSIGSGWASGTTPDYKLKVGGGNIGITGVIEKAVSGVSWINGRTAAIIKNTQNTSSSSWFPTVSSKTPNGSWETGALGEKYYFSYTTDANYSAGTNSSETVSIDSSGLYSGTAARANAVPSALTSKSTTATTTKGEIYGVAGVTSGNRIFTRWYANLNTGNKTLADGMLITITIPVAGCDSGVGLTIDGGTSFHPLVYQGSSRVTTHYGVGLRLLLMYDAGSAASVWGTTAGATATSAANITGVWRVLNTYDSNSTYYTTVPYCTTAAGTAAKSGSCSRFQLNKGYFPIMMYYTNTYAGAITLNINGTGAKSVYINGTASSSSNYSLPYGVLLCYYDGTNYHFRTDGVLPGRAQVTAVGDHYIPSANSSYALSADASSSTAATWGTTNLVTGVNISRDAAGHVTGLTVDSIKMPANPSSKSLRLTVIVSSASSTVAFGQTLANVDDLLVYQNGLLLTLDTNYTINTNHDGITLIGYMTEVGDVFTFVSGSITATSANIGASQINYSSNTLKATNVKEALDELSNGKYLPLTGGILTGALTVKSTLDITGAFSTSSTLTAKGAITSNNIITGTQLKATNITDYGNNTYNIGVINNSGQLYKRTKANFLTDFNNITTTTTSGAKAIRNIMYKTTIPLNTEGVNGDICIVYQA